MCWSIVRYSVKGETAKTVIDCRDEDHEAIVVAEIQNRPNVQGLTIFRAMRRIGKVEVWQEQPIETEDPKNGNA